jgi:hypothetical protein
MQVSIAFAVGMESDLFEFIISSRQISVLYHLIAFALAKFHF